MDWIGALIAGGIMALAILAGSVSKPASPNKPAAPVVVPAEPSALQDIPADAERGVAPGDIPTEEIVER